ncbi:MAG TPA: DinB family protein [Gemmatimonadales bacterium]|nr:DinB family protein [Gemmatimonadales bacterium]
MTTRRDADLMPALEALRVSRQRFIDRAAVLSPTRWNQPIGAGKWSPAQISEHVRLSYVVIGQELATGSGGLPLKVPRWLRPWLRFRYFGRILRTGKMPAGARAAREISPRGSSFDQQATIAGLREAAVALEEAVAARWDDPAAGFSHHVFGHVALSDGWRFAVIHTDHHRGQLPGG